MNNIKTPTKAAEKNGVGEEQKRIIRTMFDPSNKLSDEQIGLFLHVAKERGLDPRLKQICAVPRANKHTGKVEITIITMIDGFRLIAERTGKYSPGDPTQFEYDENKRLISATAFVKKQTADGTWHSVSATAFLREYLPSSPSGPWKSLPHVMLEKCAEARALRRAFPGDLSGLYAEEEMQQADIEIAAPESLKEPESKPKLSEEQVTDLIELLDYVPEYRKSVERLMQEKDIATWYDLPQASYKKILETAKAKLVEQEEHDG